MINHGGARSTLKEPPVDGGMCQFDSRHHHGRSWLVPVDPNYPLLSFNCSFILINIDIFLRTTFWLVSKLREKCIFKLNILNISTISLKAIDQTWIHSTSLELQLVYSLLILQKEVRITTSKYLFEKENPLILKLLFGEHPPH